MGKARARRASDDRLEKLQAFVDSIVVEADEIDHAGLPPERIREAQRRLIAVARTLASEDMGKRSQAPRTFHDVYVKLRDQALASSIPKPPIERVYIRGQGDDLIDVTTMDEAFNRTLVDRQDDDGFVFIRKETIKPCRPCSGTGEVIEYPPDDDERMVACPACGGTGEAITL